MDSHAGSNEIPSDSDSDVSLGSSASFAPGSRAYSGRDSNGAPDVRDVITLLNGADIFACVVGVNALRYYGAGRVTWAGLEWDICVPADRLADAVRIFDESDEYELATPPPRVPMSLRHVHPIFKLKDAGFFFILTPSSRCFVEPRPENCEFSSRGIPYPQMRQFARALLALQNGADIADFVDGMNLDEAWGEEHINFDDLQEKVLEFRKEFNNELRAVGGLCPLATHDMDFRKRWNWFVETKESRIEPMKKGRYKSRWWPIQKDMDPRLEDRNM